MRLQSSTLVNPGVNSGVHYDSSVSAIAWSAVIGGAFTASAMSLILLLLGSGFGLAIVSPWSYSGVSAATFTAAAAIWLIVMQWVASGLGGYLTGRLRSRWVNLHADEVFFRDTAHGFLSWALATVVTAVFLASAISSVLGAGTTAATQAMGATSHIASKSSHDDLYNPTTYFVDSLFRSDKVNESDHYVRLEAARILLTGIKDDGITQVDKTYLTKLVSLHTGITRDEATERLNDVTSQMNAAKQKAKEGLEKARKATMQTALYAFLSLLIGAFIASATAALGGKHRDEVSY